MNISREVHVSRRQIITSMARILYLPQTTTRDKSIKANNDSDQIDKNITDNKSIDQLTYKLKPEE